MGSPTWRCRDGRRIPVSEMATDHIENALAMLERKGFFDPCDTAWLSNPPDGDMAQMAWENELDAAKFHPAVRWFREELARRRDDELVDSLPIQCGRQ